MRKEVIRRVVFPFVLLLMIAPFVYADCTGTIMSITQDKRTGAVKVATQYVLNGLTSGLLNTRYDKNSGDVTTIKALIQKDIDTHCGNLIERIPENKDFVREKRTEIMQQLRSQDINLIITQLQSEIGKKSRSIKSKTVIFKGRTIELKDDKTHSITLVP